MSGNTTSTHNNITFSEKNYPKSYASILKGDYRLKKFSQLPNEELEKLESKLWNFIYNKTQKTQPTKKHQNNKFLAAGWEWSVFKKDNNTIIKIPAQMFAEVETHQYLINTRFAYNKISKYFPKLFIAKTKFNRTNNLNIIEQEFVSGNDSFLINFQTKNKKLFVYLDGFLKSALKMLRDEDWLPDFDIKKMEMGFALRNVVIQKDSFIPKIVDFTTYYDVYRMYQERKDYEVNAKAESIREFILWLENK